MAPDFTLPNREGKAVSLSSYKGKYVLVDFWASWCGPCRGENPYVVAAYQKYKSKNFTVLGVSLDENKDDWLEAIKKDKLEWDHISDLKGWSSLVVPMYGFDGIPYNVLLDPTGKIIATELREEALDLFLSKAIK
jgi:peroxiredoxin